MNGVTQMTIDKGRYRLTLMVVEVLAHARSRLFNVLHREMLKAEIFGFLSGNYNRMYFFLKQNIEQSLDMICVNRLDRIKVSQ